jgi:hypothetical protein
MSGVGRHTRRWYLRLIRRKAVWVRIPAGLLLIAAGLLGFLPVLGFWMIPIGIALIGRDIPFVRGLVLQAIRKLRNRRSR